MVYQFTQEAISKYQLPKLVVAPELLARFKHAHYPGNIRQLRNYVERACITAHAANSQSILPEHLPNMPAKEQVMEKDFQAQTLDFQRRLLLDVLSRNDWNVSKTARELNLSRSHVHNLIKQFDLERNRA